MILHQAQKQIALDNHRFKVLCCGRRFGKSLYLAEEIKATAVLKPTEIAYVANTYQQARDIMWNLLVKELKPIIKKTNESRLELTTHSRGGESKITLRGWENIETLRGLKYNLVCIDEVATMRNFKLNWDEVIRPTLTDYQGKGIFCSTPYGFNHFYDLYNKERDDKDYKSFHFTSYDNPFLPREELEKAKQELPEDKFGQEYLADFRKSTGLVYKEFDRDKHLYTVLPKEFRLIAKMCGIDWGYNNPAAVIEILKDQDNRFYLNYEWYKTQQSTDQIIEIAQSLKANAYYPDPAEPDRIDIARRAKLNIRDVSKDVEAGIESVRELFKQNRLFIRNTLTNTIWELETYSYKDKRPDQNEPEEPIKENDHIMDAMRYVLHMQHQSTQTKQIRPILRTRSTQRAYI